MVASGTMPWLRNLAFQACTTECDPGMQMPCPSGLERSVAIVLTTLSCSTCVRQVLTQLLLHDCSDATLVVGSSTTGEGHLYSQDCIGFSCLSLYFNRFQSLKSFVLLIPKSCILLSLSSNYHFSFVIWFYSVYHSLLRLVIQNVSLLGMATPYTDRASDQCARSNLSFIRPGMNRPRPLCDKTFLKAGRSSRDATEPERRNDG